MCKVEILHDKVTGLETLTGQLASLFRTRCSGFLLAALMNSLCSL